MFTKVSEIPEVGRHALDAPAMPPRKLGAQESIEETLWMRMWQDLVPDLNSLNGALNGKALDLEGMSRLAVAVRPGEGEPLEQLESFVQGLLRPLVDDALGRLLPEDHGLHAVLGWRLYLTREGSLDEAVKALETTEPAVYAALEATKKTAARELTSRMWRLGNPGSLVAKAVPELRLIALSFLDALDEIESELVRCPLVTDADVREILLGELPLKMALELDSRPAGEGPSPSKTDFAPIITEAQARAFPRIPQVIEAKESMLVLGPTGCGKSRVGHVAAAHTVYAARRRHEEARALILVPTKTMVRENHQRWLEWTKADDASWRVVAGSADDREYDEALAHGEYDVGICVYEKLASLVYSGSDVLNRVGLIVVDEFQNLAQGQRGVSLEALLTILRMGPYPIPIVALSASLTNESTKTARRWLDVKHMVEVSSRPTELRYSLVDGVTRRTRVVPAATTGSDGSGPSVHVDEPSVPHQIGPIPDVWPHSLRQRISDIRVTLPILQICQLLDSDEVADRRILCFVRDRDRAREVATLLRECLDLQHPLGRLPRQPNPWKLGRYAADLDLSDAARRDRYEQFLWTEDNYWRKEVQRGFLSGVTYHTRTLQMPLRHRIEDEFDAGLVRVLVCTDTLAEGVNLSASDVVVADLTQRSHGAEEPISVGKLKNRAGRAGRLGKSQPQGTAYIVIDPRFPTRLLRSPEDAPRLSELDSAWRHWIEQEAPEEALGSALADSGDGHDNLCGLVLRALAVDNRFRTREELVERIDEVISNTLWAAWGGHAEAERIIDELEERDLVDTEPGGGDASVAPDGDAVVERLLEAQVVAEVAEQPDQLQVTKLGMAVARSALPLNSANHILRVAGGGSASIGDLSLLHLSAQDPSVKSTLARKWLAWKRPYDQNPDQRDHVIKQVQLYAATYGHPQHRVRKAVAERKWRLPLPTERGEVEWYEPDPALVERDPRPMSRVLERWICDTNLVEDGAQGTYASEKEFAVSVLRAVVAYEWANLQPFKEMKLRLDSITTPRRKIRRKMREPDPAIPFSVTDLEQLGERVGYVLGAASELLEDNPVARERLSVLSDECAHGVPLWLIPLARLNLDGLGREPLIGIHRNGVKQVDDLAELLRREDLGIPDRVRRRALKRYEEIRARSQDSYVQLPADLENVSMASAEGQPYADVWRNLMDGDRADSRELKAVFSELLAGHQIPAAVSVESGLVVAGVGSGPDQLDLVVINGNLNRTKLNALRRRSRPSVAVPLRLPQPGIIWELNRPGSVTRGIQPRALMVLLYGLRQDHREDVGAKFVECFADYPAGFAGIGVVRRMLERLRIEAPVQLEDFVKEFEE